MRRFPRTSPMHGMQNDAAEIVQARVINVNTVNWTVDVLTQFDQRRFFEVQVASPYMHYNNGEGCSAMPEVGAVCMLCIPSDSSPPYVMSFIMPFELINDAGTADAPLGTSSHGQPQKNATAASFAGGRPKAKPGDLWFRTRDENFIILHRGGVLQIGSTPLSQRIFIPLNNMIMDVSGNYAHHNSGGTMSWGLQEGPSLTHFPAQFMHTFRVFADDKEADIRITAGKVYNPVPEPDGAKGESDALQQLKIGTEKDSPIIYEVVVAQKGFNAEDGAMVDAGVRNKTMLRFFFDRAGGAFLRCEGSLLVSVRKKLKLKVSDDMEIVGQKSLSVVMDQDITINGKSSVTITGGVVRLGPGTSPVARLGDIVQIILPFTPAPASNTPFVVTGTVLTGNPKVMV